MTKKGQGVVLCLTLVEIETGWRLSELKVTSTSNFNVKLCSCNVSSSLCVLGWVKELFFINLMGSVVYRGSSFKVRII